MSTPLMKQYAQVKAKYPGTILLFRMGDFFETFEEDAKITARVLGITLTKRGNGSAGEIPLAGFPHHALDAYLPKLLKAGYRVAVCEQMEDPRLARGIVKRDVIEVVTPGVAFSDKILDQKQNNYLAAVAFSHALASGDDLVGLAFIDVSTAEFHTSEFPLRHLVEQISNLAPAELLVQERDRAALQDLLHSSFRGLLTKMDDWVFTFEYARDALTRQFQVQSLQGFGLATFEPGVVAAGAVMHYLQETQKANLHHLRKVTPVDIGETITLDPATKRNLEITYSIDGSATLYSVLDLTTTPMGGRLLKRWINQPLKNLEQIKERLDAVEVLFQDALLRKSLSALLSDIGDLERLNTRICTGRATPRDLIALKAALGEVGRISSTLHSLPDATLSDVRSPLNSLPQIQERIASAIEDDPPLSLADGGVIRKGYHAGLDELRATAFGGKQWVADLQKKERERTGIPSLKVGFNNVFGYYIEVTNTHREKIPEDYLRKQTLTSAERYITPELKEHEERILHAEESILELETQLFTEVRLTVTAETERIQADAQALARLDCFLSLATAAAEYGYTRPDVNESTTLEILGGRHPVIERLLPPGEDYIPNDLHLDTESDQIIILTGPNMSGKSSYLRQVGLIVLLAQMGSYVPARSARIGLVDRIFTRVGASDRITSGESTFLVEMHEAAHIVNTASRRSLILLDEVGRGTSTFDGISIAWALTEYLHERIGARTLFATHYHELNELADHFPRIRNSKVEVREYGDRVVFLHQVTPGVADHSYGIQVAQMAGLPVEITDRAGRILKNLESSELTLPSGAEGGSRHSRGRVGGGGMQLTLFEPGEEALKEELEKIEIDQLTPLEALKKLSELKNRSRNSDSFTKHEGTTP